MTSTTSPNKLSLSSPHLQHKVRDSPTPYGILFLASFPVNSKVKTHRVDVNLTGGAGGLSSSSDMVRGGGGCPNVLNLAVYAVIQITKQVLLVPHPPRLEIPLVFLRAIRVFASQPLNSPGHRLITKPTSISCCRFIPTHCQSGWLWKSSLLSCFFSKISSQITGYGISGSVAWHLMANNNRSEKSRKANHLQTVKYALKLITRIIALPTFLLKIDLMSNSVLTPSRPFFNFYQI